MPESAQEAFVAAFTAASLGAPFMWEPAPYRKGSGTREPADLAWLCRGTIFLMNMKEGNSTAESLHRGNMKQLRGWLRMWERGVKLQGSNEWRSFDLELEGLAQIVLISIVEGEDAKCAVVPAPSVPGIDDGKLLLSAQLTPVVLFFLAEHAGSACDLADLLLYLASCPQPLDEREVLQHLHAMWVAGRHRALLLCERERDQELDDVTLRTILRVGRMAGSDSPPPDELAETMASINDPTLDGHAIFNDWDFETTYLLLYLISDMVNKVRHPQENGEWQAFSITHQFSEPYHFVVTAINAKARATTWENGRKYTFDLIEKLRAEDPSRPVFQMSGKVEGPSPREVNGMMIQYGPEPPRTTSDTLRVAADLVRQRNPISGA